MGCDQSRIWRPEPHGRSRQTASQDLLVVGDSTASYRIVSVNSRTAWGEKEGRCQHTRETVQAGWLPVSLHARDYICQKRLSRGAQGQGRYYVFRLVTTDGSWSASCMVSSPFTITVLSPVGLAAVWLQTHDTDGTELKTRAESRNLNRTQSRGVGLG